MFRLTAAVFRPVIFFSPKTIARYQSRNHTWDGELFDWVLVKWFILLWISWWCTRWRTESDSTNGISICSNRDGTIDVWMGSNSENEDRWIQWDEWMFRNIFPKKFFAKLLNLVLVQCIVVMNMVELVVVDWMHRSCSKHYHKDVLVLLPIWVFISKAKGNE